MVAEIPRLRSTGVRCLPNSRRTDGRLGRQRRAEIATAGAPRFGLTFPMGHMGLVFRKLLAFLATTRAKISGMAPVKSEPLWYQAGGIEGRPLRE